MMENNVKKIMTGMLCALMLCAFSAGSPQLRPKAAETILAVTTAPQATDPDAEFGDLPEPPSAADAENDVQAVLAEAEQEKEQLRENADIQGTRYGLFIGGAILVGLCAVAVYYFKFNKHSR